MSTLELNETVMPCINAEPFQFSDFLLSMAHCVHGLVALLPDSVINECENREVLSEPVKDMHPSGMSIYHSV